MALTISTTDYARLIDGLKGVFTGHTPEHKRAYEHRSDMIRWTYNNGVLTVQSYAYLRNFYMTVQVEGESDPFDCTTGKHDLSALAGLKTKESVQFSFQGTSLNFVNDGGNIFPPCSTEAVKTFINPFKSSEINEAEVRARPWVNLPSAEEFFRAAKLADIPTDRSAGNMRVVSHFARICVRMWPSYRAPSPEGYDMAFSMFSTSPEEDILVMTDIPCRAEWDQDATQYDTQFGVVVNMEYHEKYFFVRPDTLGYAAKALDGSKPLALCIAEVNTHCGWQPGTLLLSQDDVVVGYNLETDEVRIFNIEEAIKGDTRPFVTMDKKGTTGTKMFKAELAKANKGSEGDKGTELKGRRDEGAITIKNSRSRRMGEEWTFRLPSANGTIHHDDRTVPFLANKMASILTENQEGVTLLTHPRFVRVELIGTNHIAYLGS